MSDITEIKPSVNDSARAVLTEMLQRVEAGEIDGVAIAYTSNGGGIGSVWSGSRNQLGLWSAAAHTERRFYNDVIRD